MSFEVIVYRPNGVSSTFTGSFKKYEETYDGTNAGWYNFRKDVKENLSLKKDDFQLELKVSEETWVPLDAGKFQEGLENAQKNGKLTVRHVDKNKKQVHDAEKGNLDVEHTKSSSSSGGRSCFGTFCRHLFLIIIYCFLFPLWLIGIVGCFIIDLIFLPIECLCPCCCICLECCEWTDKKAFKFVIWILKAPFKFAKKILN